MGQRNKSQPRLCNSYAGTAVKCQPVLTEGDETHEEDLDPTAQEQREQHAFPRRTEHITMDQLPSKLLLGFLLQCTKWYQIIIDLTHKQVLVCYCFGIHMYHSIVIPILIINLKHNQVLTITFDALKGVR